MSNEENSKHRCDHNGKERPIEFSFTKILDGFRFEEINFLCNCPSCIIMPALTIKSSDHGEEAKDDHDHDAGHQVDEDLQEHDGDNKQDDDDDEEHDDDHHGDDDDNDRCHHKHPGIPAAG